MTDAKPRTLVISDGGLPALVAAAIESERLISGGSAGGALMPWPTDAEAATEQLSAVSCQARFLRLDLVEPITQPPPATISGAEGFADCLGLLAGLYTARACGCSRVVWPVQFHNDDASLAGDLDRIAVAVDRAVLVGRLGLLEPGGSESAFVAVETPLADLTDAQVADLVVDLDAPAYLAWWWRRLGQPETERRAAEERRAWLGALRHAGWVESGPQATVAAQAEAGAANTSE